MVGDAPFLVELAQHDCDGVDFPVGKILVGAEKVLEKADMLAELAAFSKGSRYELAVILGIGVLILLNIKKPPHLCDSDKVILYIDITIVS